MLSLGGKRRGLILIREVFLDQPLIERNDFFGSIGRFPTLRVSVRPPEVEIRRFEIRMVLPRQPCSIAEILDYTEQILLEDRVRRRAVLPDAVRVRPAPCQHADASRDA